MTQKGQGRAILGAGASKPSFQFNINAQEFVPRNYQTAPPPDQSQNYQEANYGINKLWEAIVTLTSSPASFDQLMPPLVADLNSFINSEKLLLNVVEDIFNQSLSDDNFRYMGARMCDYLSNNLTIQAESGNFQAHILKRCHQEHKQREILVQNPDTQSRLVGYTLFMGELLLAMRIYGEPMGQLVRPIEELLSTLLTQPTDANLKCVAKVLKLTGAILDSTEKSDNDGQTPNLDEILKKIKELLVDVDSQRSIKSLLLSVVELRAMDWGMTQAQVVPTYDQAPPSQHQHYGEEPVFYDEHGQVIPYEEAVYMPDFCEYPNDAAGDWSNVPEMYSNAYNGEEYGAMPDTSDSGMDDEIAAAFEQFILENETAQNNHTRPY